MIAPREVILVDVESSGLDPEVHTAVEVASWNLDTDSRDCFIPPHNISEVLAGANVYALRLNRYIDRLAAPHMQDHNGDRARLLAEQLNGNTLAGSNPAFDAVFLRRMFGTYYGREFAGLVEWTWHHRMLDLSAYAAGVLGLPAGDLPGLAKVCELLDVPALPDHTASQDVTAAGLCFRRLAAISRQSRVGSSEVPA